MRIATLRHKEDTAKYESNTVVSITHPTHQVFMGVSAMEEAMASALEILKADKFRSAEVHAPKRTKRQSASLLGKMYC